MDNYLVTLNACIFDSTIWVGQRNQVGPGKDPPASNNNPLLYMHYPDCRAIMVAAYR